MTHMCKNFENQSSSLFMSSLVALVYAFIFLMVGLLPRLAEVVFLPFLYSYLFVCFIISSLYCLVLFFIWTWNLAVYSAPYGGNRHGFYWAIFSFFIPIYNLVGPYIAYNGFAKILRIGGMKVLLIAWQALFWITVACFILAGYLTLTALDLFSYRLGIYVLFLSVIFEMIYLATLLFMVKRFGDGFKNFYDGRAD